MDNNTQLWKTWKGPILKDIAGDAVCLWTDPKLKTTDPLIITWFVGVEVHKLKIVFAIYGRIGKYRIFGPIFDLQNHLEAWAELPEYFKDFPPYRFFMETTGVFHFRVYWKLQELFPTAQVFVMNATELKNLMKAIRQSDDVDAAKLAQIASYDEFIQPSYVPSPELATFRDKCRFQQKLVQHQTQTVNRLKKILDLHGITWKFSIKIQSHLIVLEKWFTEDLSLEEARNQAYNETISKHKQRGLIGLKKKVEKWGKIKLSSQLRSHCKFLLLNLFVLIDLREKLEGQIMSDLDLHLNLKQGVDLLEYLPGCRLFSRILLMSEIGEISRFRDVNAFLAYVGIGPSGKTSGIADFDEQTEKIVVRDHPNPQCNRRIKLILLTAARTVMKGNVDSSLQNDIERYAEHINSRKMQKLKKHFKIASKIGRKIYYCLKSQIKFDLSHETVYNDVLEELIEKRQKQRKQFEQTWKKKRNSISWDVIETSLSTLGIKTGLASKFLKKISNLDEIQKEG